MKMLDIKISFKRSKVADLGHGVDDVVRVGLDAGFSNFTLQEKSRRSGPTASRIERRN